MVVLSQPFTGFQGNSIPRCQPGTDSRLEEQAGKYAQRKSRHRHREGKCADQPQAKSTPRNPRPPLGDDPGDIEYGNRQKSGGKHQRKNQKRGSLTRVVSGDGSQKLGGPQNHQDNHHRVNGNDVTDGTLSGNRRTGFTSLLLIRYRQGSRGCCPGFLLKENGG
jgi:hypothetical protein